MKSCPKEAGDRTRSRGLSILGSVEGYASAFIAFCVFLVPVSPGTQRQSTILIVTLIGLGLGLGVGGIRFGEGASRVAAWSSVVVLSLLFVVLIVKGV